MGIRRRHVAGVLAAAAAVVYSFVSGSAPSNPTNPTVQDYYDTIETRLGYKLLLGNTRHCGYWEKGTLWPFPLGKALRRMEEKVYSRLDLDANSRVLDAGVGSAYVAMYMAEKGLNVHGVDITPWHVEQAQNNVRARGLENRVSVSLGDYHNLTDLPDRSFDGVYTMETFVHADDPLKALKDFYRILKPGGVLVQHEADYLTNFDTLPDILRFSHCQNTLSAGTLTDMMKEAGFKVVDVEDLSDEILPLWRLFGFLGYIPYQIIRVLGLQNRFVNAVAGVEVYLNWEKTRYISVKAIKP